MKIRRHPLAAVFAIMMAGSVCLAGCGASVASDTEDEAAAMPVAVETTTPVRGDIYATYAASASLSSDADAPVSARAAGEVVELLVEEGDRVTAGQVLARLDGERLRLEMLAAKANLERARKEYLRNVDLHARGLISTSMFDGLKFDLASLQASYDLKRLNHGYSNIRATISGVVSSRDIKPGETLTVGQVAFRITETSELIAYLKIPQAELGKFDVGHAATVNVVSRPGVDFAATIVRISPTIDIDSGTFRATAIIDNSSDDLAPGMFGRFTVAYEKHTDVLVIPSNALLDEDDETTVYVVRNGEVSRQAVTIGIKQRGRVEILSGLQDGDEIVVVGHSGLRDGSKVLASSADGDRLTG